MKVKDFEALKDLLLKRCIKIVDAKINHLKIALQEAQNAANNETKSSAGDKHETGRAMAQLETEKLTNQLITTSKLLTILAKVNLKIVSKTVVLGSLVLTNNGFFYVSVSLGKITINQQTIFAISALSPIGKLLLAQKEQTTFLFNEKSYTILQIY